MEIIGIIILLISILSFVVAIFLTYMKLDKIDRTISAERNAMGVDQDEIINLAISHWRFKKHIERMCGTIDSKDKRRLENVARQFEAFLNNYEAVAEDYTGRTFNEGMNVDVIACEEDPESDRDYVKETESPAVFMDKTLCKRAVVIVARGKKGEEVKEGKKDGEK